MANLTGSYVYFTVRAFQIKMEMRARLASLPDDQLELIVLSSEEFKRAQVEEHEIRVNGKMFDIARISEDGNQVFVYGIYDEAEDNLLVFLDTVLTNLQHDSQKTPQSISLFGLLQYLPSDSCFDFALGLPTHETQCVYLITSYSYTPSSDSPPPRYVCYGI